MTTANSTVDIEYKTGTSDDVGFVLDQNNAVIDLTDWDVVFNIRNTTLASEAIPVSCTLGSIVEGIEYTAAQGGVTINFTGEDLAEAGEYHCEFVISKDGKEKVIPNEDSQYILVVNARVNDV